MAGWRISAALVLSNDDRSSSAGSAARASAWGLGEHDLGGENVIDVPVRAETR
jgi:hypothetical protein